MFIPTEVQRCLSLERGARVVYAFAPTGRPVVIHLARRSLSRLIFAIMLACAVLPQADARSGNGYNLPDSTTTTPSRRPNVGSGGYSAPSGGTTTKPAPAMPPASGGDRAMSRQQSGTALQNYRAQQAPPPAPQPAAPPVYGSSTPAYAPSPAPSYQPAYSNNNGGSGFVQGALLGVLLQSLSQPGRDRYFYDHQEDPAYRQWRIQADQQAQTDAGLRQKLQELDGKIATLQGQPRNPAAPPPPDVAPRKGGSMIWIVLFIGVALLVLLFVWRRRLNAAATTQAVPVPESISGSKRTRFRVGMTMPMDPSPFILAQGCTKIHLPEGGAMASVEAVGVLEEQGITLNRLYLPNNQGFFQLHLGADGTPDECRWFSQIDEVTPASDTEWAAWLDPAQGMIGYPQFQTKDGKLYDRVWAPGETRIEPRVLTETVQTLDAAGKIANSSHKLMAMLYARPTGAPAPAPQTEYILVAAVDAGERAWVELHAGIDISPQTLTLPATSL
jgi:hypothetical protein